MSTVHTGSTPVVRPSAGLIPAKDMAVIWVLLAAAFVAILNETTMGIAIPHLITDLGITPIAAQWVTSAFMLTMAVVIPTTGWFLQRVGRRIAFMTAMACFSVGTLIAALSPTFEVLLFGRVVQATGTAVMMPLLMSSVLALAPESQRGRIMGNVSLAISVAPAMGPTVSGLILAVASWRWLFGAVLPLAILVGVLGSLGIIVGVTSAGGGGIGMWIIAGIVLGLCLWGARRTGLH